MKTILHSRSTLFKQGFSLVELLVVVIIVGILASITIPFVSEIWKSQIAISNLENLRGWVEKVRRSSLRGQACEVNISTSNLRDGSTVLDSIIFGTEAIESNPCGSPASIALESSYNKEYYLLTVKSGSSTVDSFVFTPRGTLYNNNVSPAFDDDIVFNLSIANPSYAKSSKSYCLRMSSFLGSVISIGSGAC